MPLSHKALRPLLLLCAGAAFSCGGVSSCGGCQGQPIPGGFPAEEIYFNASQIRISDYAFTFLEQNFETLLQENMNGDTTFNMGGSSSGSYRICQNTTCTGTFDILSTQFYLLPQSTVAISVRTLLYTSNMPFEIDVPLVGWEQCSLSYDTGRTGLPDLHFTAHLEFEINDADRRKLTLRRGESVLDGFEYADFNVSGGVVCELVQWVASYFEDELRKQLADQIFKQIDKLLEKLPLGQEGRVNLATSHPEPSALRKGTMDYFLWAGGFALNEGGGLSLGAMGGFRPLAHDDCVPRREAPTVRSLAPSLLLKGNLRPDGKPFQVGVSLHRQILDSALYALYDSGGLCVDLSKETVAQLSSNFFTLLAPSIGQLTGGVDHPMRLALRPRYPFHVIYGQGTHHVDGEGNVVIDDPLIRLMGRELTLDLTMQLDGRWVRLLSVVGDLDIPMLLTATTQGELQPVTGNLKEALTNTRVENSDLLGESPEELAKIFPMLFGLATGSLADVFSPIAIPEVTGLQALMDQGSIATLDQDILAIFIDFGLAQNTSLDEPFELEATLEELHVPPRERFALGPGFDPGAGPALTIALAARLPQRWAHRADELEYAYRIDGGFYRPWSKATRVVVRDPLFWLGGEHLLEIRARLPGIPGAMTPMPTELTVQIDPPTRRRSTSTTEQSAPRSEAGPGGCAISAPSSGSTLWLVLALLLWRQRRHE